METYKVILSVSPLIPNIAKVNNKRQHAINGNNALNDDIVILQVNTGNGKARCNDDKLRVIINGSKAKIVVILDSNIDTEYVDQIEERKRLFDGFNFHDKVLPGSGVVCLSIYMNKEL